MTAEHEIACCYYSITEQTIIRMYHTRVFITGNSLAQSSLTTLLGFKAFLTRPVNNTTIFCYGHTVRMLPEASGLRAALFLLP